MIQKCFSATLAVVSVTCFHGVGTAAEQSNVPQEVVEAVTEGDPQRYSLVSADGDILRVDRQNGTVSFCTQKNASWRCNPVPLAEEAYQAEINALASEVERLTARLEELEAEEGQDAKPLPPGAALDRPKKENGAQEDAAPEPEGTDEEELEKVLSFTETAMRRFFGMVRELQKELDDSGN